MYSVKIFTAFVKVVRFIALVLLALVLVLLTMSYYRYWTSLTHFHLESALWVGCFQFFVMVLIGSLFVYLFQQNIKPVPTTRVIRRFEGPFNVKLIVAATVEDVRRVERAAGLNTALTYREWLQENNIAPPEFLDTLERDIGQTRGHSFGDIDDYWTKVYTAFAKREAVLYSLVDERRSTRHMEFVPLTRWPVRLPYMSKEFWVVGVDGNDAHNRRHRDGDDPHRAQVVLGK